MREQESGSGGWRGAAQPARVVRLVLHCGKAGEGSGDCLGARTVATFKSSSAEAGGINGELFYGERWKADDRESSTESKVRPKLWRRPLLSGLFYCVSRSF